MERFREKSLQEIFRFSDGRRGELELRKDPVFTNVLLADEIIRATPRTQAGLLESMEERQVKELPRSCTGKGRPGKGTLRKTAQEQGGMHMIL